MPKFILRDKNGYALARAIEAGLNAMNRVVAQGVSQITDVDAMEEWRLDELAWEYNLLYDYAESLENKRRWVKDAAMDYARYGTPAAVRAYLEGIFDSVDVDEEGDPFHFRVVLTGEYSQETLAWAEKAVARVKNVRSVLDGISFNGDSVHVPLWVAAAVCGVDIADTAVMV